jgi:lysophospholipase L1-like esterase
MSTFSKTFSSAIHAIFSKESFTFKHPVIAFAGAVIIAIVIVLAYSIARGYFLYQNTIVLEARISPFNTAAKNGPENPNESKDAPFRILVLGDSTAVGTGATRAEDSTAGRLAQKYPNSEVTNLAVNGLKIAGLESILKNMDASQNHRYNIVLIQIGANDIIRLTPMKDIEAGIGRILARSKELAVAEPEQGIAGDTMATAAGMRMQTSAGTDARTGTPASGKVIFLHSGDVGEGEFFPIYLNPILSKRSFQMREIYKKAATKYDASYVDLIGSSFSKVAKENPGLYYSNDYLHPSSEGYGLWFNEIEKKL